MIFVDLMQREIHALAMNLLAPDEVNATVAIQKRVHPTSYTLQDTSLLCNLPYATYCFRSRAIAGEQYRRGAEHRSGQ